MTGVWLFWGLIFGAAGLGMLVYGRRQSKPVPFTCGLALMVFPYFVSNLYLLVGLGVALLITPYFIRL